LEYQNEKKENGTKVIFEIIKAVKFPKLIADTKPNHISRKPRGHQAEQV
jgi:hypothetical protein